MLLPPDVNVTVDGKVTAMFCPAVALTVKRPRVAVPTQTNPPQLIVPVAAGNVTVPPTAPDAMIPKSRKSF